MLQERLNSSLEWDYEVNLNNSRFEPDLGKYTFSVSNNTTQPIFIFDNNTLIYEQMGFNKNSENTFIDGLLISENVVKFIPEDTLFLHSNLVLNNNNDILQEVYNNNASTFSNIVYHCNNHEMYSKPIRDNKANVYNFKLCDELGNLINLNGLNMMITLLLYKNDNIKDIIKNYILYELNKK